MIKKSAVTITPTDEDARIKVMAARIIAQQRWPYMSSLLFSLRLVQTEHHDVSTMAVDAGWRMYYSPTFIHSLDPKELATVLMHESMHCVLKHSSRFQEMSLGPIRDDFREHADFYAYVWNLAGDCSANLTIDQMGAPFPKDNAPVRYSDFASAGLVEGEITEVAFLKLVKHLRPQYDDDAGHVHTDCGSVIGGLPRKYEMPTDDAETPAANSTEQDRVRDRLASDVLAAKEQGNMPAGLVRWAEDYLDPKIDWRKALAVRIRAAVASVAGRRDYSFMRPSRRQDAMRNAGSTVILPAMRQPAPPRIAIVVDTSGSITADELNGYLGEMRGMVRAVGVSHGLWVIPCDAQAYEATRVKSSASLELINFKGGGGTNMCKGIDAALALQPKPHIIIVLTDGFTPWPTERPKGQEHYIVVLTTDEARSQVPEWATTILIEKD